MKIKPEHYEELQMNISIICLANNISLPDLAQSNKWVTSMRMRWNLFAAVQRRAPELCKELYTYLNDDRIDTALRAITKTH